MKKKAKARTVVSRRSGIQFKNAVPDINGEVQRLHPGVAYLHPAIARQKKLKRRQDAERKKKLAERKRADLPHSGKTKKVCQIAEKKTDLPHR